LTGGDVVSQTTVKKAQLLYPQATIINGYGPTENTTFTCCYAVPQNYQIASSLPIGKPIANTKVYIMNARQQLVPIGAIGELCTSGDGVAQGYWNADELTREKFLENSAELEDRIYRTGDLARWLVDGNIEFLGRIDHQVKVRGFRIELGEIENVLRQFPLVEQAFVTILEQEQKQKMVVAYVVAHQDVSETSLKNHLSQKLPSYMMPSAFVFLSSLPLTPNNKIDRKALPHPEENRKSEIVPQTELEKLLADIWSDVVGIKNIGIKDNFFDLGGHSLLATQIAIRMSEILPFTIPVSYLFEYNTISLLAGKIEELRQQPCDTSTENQTDYEEGEI
jgi:aspartate racemase